MIDEDVNIQSMKSSLNMLSNNVYNDCVNFIAENGSDIIQFDSVKKNMTLVKCLNTNDTTTTTTTTTTILDVISFSNECFLLVTKSMNQQQKKQHIKLQIYNRQYDSSSSSGIGIGIGNTMDEKQIHIK